MLSVGGFVPLSTTDWPDHLAAVVFIQGCPWRCHYCHNPDLQSRQDSGMWSWPRLLDKLAERQGLLDGVVFSGGEATLDRTLPEAMQAVRQLGLKVGLHTAGIYPDRLAAVLPLTDWVGFDVKAHIAQYAAITDVPGSGVPAWRSLALLMQSGVSHELRTTYHPHLHDDAQMQQLAQTLQDLGAQEWVIQGFQPSPDTHEKLGRIRRHVPEALLAHLRSTGLRVLLR